MADDKDERVGFSKTEKRLLLGESTFVSIGFVAVIIAGTIFVASIKGEAAQNAENIKNIRSDVRDFKAQYLKQMELYRQDINKIGTSLGRIEGKLDRGKK